jgi:hypothetical protein
MVEMKNNSKIKGAKNIARVLFKLNHFLEPYGLTSDMKRLRFVNRSLLRWHTGIETPIK